MIARAHLACPLCGVGDVPVPPHARGAAWTAEQIAWVRKLHGIGLSYDRIGRLLGCSKDVVAAAVVRELQRERAA